MKRKCCPHFQPVPYRRDLSGDKVNYPLLSWADTSIPSGQLIVAAEDFVRAVRLPECTHCHPR